MNERARQELNYYLSTDVYLQRAVAEFENFSQAAINYL